jgi:probable HAF family extracellular repeat protein
MAGLGRLPNGTISLAEAVNADGSVIVGRARNSNNQDAAFIWTADGGMRELQGILQSHYGVTLSGWQLHSATGVSADGKVIAGYGTNPVGRTEGWMVVLPEPSGVLPAIALAVGLLRRRRGH